jgi:hypothetical protein
MARNSPTIQYRSEGPQILNRGIQLNQRIESFQKKKENPSDPNWNRSRSHHSPVGSGGYTLTPGQELLIEN